MKGLQSHKHSGSQETMAIGHRTEMGRQMDRQLDGHTGSESGSGSGSNLSERGSVGSTGTKNAKEVDEFDVREDLVAWKLPEGVEA